MYGILDVFLFLSVEFVNPTSIAPSTSHGLMELHFSGIPKFYTQFLNVQNSSSYYHNDFETKIISHFLHLFLSFRLGEKGRCEVSLLSFYRSPFPDTQISNGNLNRRKKELQKG